MTSPESKLTPTPPEELRAQGRKPPEFTQEVTLPGGEVKTFPKSYVIPAHKRPQNKPPIEKIVAVTDQTGQPIMDQRGNPLLKKVSVGSLKPRGPKFTSALYDSNSRRDFDYETPKIESPLDPVFAPVPLNPHIFPGDTDFDETETANDNDRSFTIELLQDSPELRAERSEKEQREFDKIQSDLTKLGRTQRVLEYVGRKINRGEGYMQRMSDQEYDEYGEELRPSTKFELKVAKRLEKIERERREELYRLFILEDPDYAEISGRDSMTPPRAPAATQKELQHHANNREVRAHLQHRIHELDEEFRMLITTPQRTAAELIEKYERRQDKRERSSGRRERVNNAARRIGRLATTGGRNLAAGTDAIGINTRIRVRAGTRNLIDGAEAIAGETDNLIQVSKPQYNRPPSNKAAKQHRREERKEQIRQTGRAAKKAVNDVLIDPAKEIASNLRDAGRPEINTPPKRNAKVRNRGSRQPTPEQQQAEAELHAHRNKRPPNDEDDDEE